MIRYGLVFTMLLFMCGCDGRSGLERWHDTELKRIQVEKEKVQLEKLKNARTK